MRSFTGSSGKPFSPEACGEARWWSAERTARCTRWTRPLPRCATPRRKKEGDRDHFLAYHDSLTGLPNRALFLRLLEQALAHCARSARRLAVLFIDLDHFKPVNDTLGHQLGDLLLATVAERLRASVRKSDVVARLAGDEFTVIQTDIVDVRPARALARTLVRALGRPFMLKGRPDDGTSPEELLQRADLAMYRAKEQGRNRYRFYEAQQGGGPGEGERNSH